MTPGRFVSQTRRLTVGSLEWQVGLCAQLAQLYDLTLVGWICAKAVQAAQVLAEAGKMLNDA